MIIHLNGAEKEISGEPTLGLLLNNLDLEGTRYAVEVNEELVPRSEHLNYQLQPGDAVEIVQAIGGG